MWTITPRPRLMKPTMESPGTGLQQWAMRTIMSSTPRTEMPPVLGGGGGLCSLRLRWETTVSTASGVSRISGGETMACKRFTTCLVVKRAYPMEAILVH
ncbi:MAG: hypothetical protein ACLSHC_16465 [Bilophila wadsworthia]